MKIQVGEEVVKYLKEQGFPLDEIWSFKEQIADKPLFGGHHIDLFRSNSWLLVQSDLKAGNISVCGIDTYTDASFFSARREGVSCGRIISAIRRRKHLLATSAGDLISVLSWLFQK